MCYNNIRGNANGRPQTKGRYKMNGTKMTKAFFFKMIEERLYNLASEVEKLKAREDLSFEERSSRENILFGRLIELKSMNSLAMNVDYWKYCELNEKITAVRDSI